MGDSRAQGTDPLLGQVIDGRYRVLEVVGYGGMSVVYRAEQTSAHGRDVAVKLLGSSRATANLLAQRFENEARIIATLRHPNTLKLIDSGRLEDGRLYLITEFLRGVPLDAVIERAPLTVERTLNVLRQVADSLIEAHAMGVVHRDLKPSNIFLEEVAGSEIVKVLDFGIAKLVDLPGLTAPNKICGTPAYMAPEQIRGLRVDARTDVYALGAIGYECLSGRPVFDAETTQLFFAMHLGESPVPLAAQPLDEPIDPELDQLFLRMLDKDLEKRPRDMAEVKAVLERIQLRRAAHEPAATLSVSLLGPAGIAPDPEASVEDATRYGNLAPRPRPPPPAHTTGADVEEEPTGLFERTIQSRRVGEEDLAGVSSGDRELEGTDALPLIAAPSTRAEKPGRLQDPSEPVSLPDLRGAGGAWTPAPLPDDEVSLDPPLLTSSALQAIDDEATADSGRRDEPSLSPVLLAHASEFAETEASSLLSPVVPGAPPPAVAYAETPLAELFAPTHKSPRAPPALPPLPAVPPGPAVDPPRGSSPPGEVLAKLAPPKPAPLPPRPLMGEPRPSEGVRRTSPAVPTDNTANLLLAGIGAFVVLVGLSALIFAARYWLKANEGPAKPTPGVTATPVPKPVVTPKQDPAGPAGERGP